MTDERRIFSGEYSKDMWKEIDKAKNIADLRSALYTICCRLQELEVRIEKVKA
jgi:two-component SAPR family response regulator